MLDGMKVVSLCHYLQGPAATQYLADMGADVIKVEPVHGAFERRWSGADVFVGGVSGLYLSANRNKRNLALDLKSSAGREILLRLVETVDVVVSNFRPGVLERLGLGDDMLRRHKPDLIIALATGFGSTGPMADQPGQDLLVQARTGLMLATGGGEHPTAAGCAVADQHGASLLAMGILGAYVKKLRTGQGTRVESSLFNAGIDLQMEAITNYLSAGFDKSRMQRDPHLGSWFHQAPYGVYKLVDGFIAISNVDAQVLAEALDSDELRDLAHIDRYVERDRYAQTFEQVVAPMTLTDLATRLDSAKVWYAPVHGYEDLASDPQALHNDVFRDVIVNNERATLVNHPLRYDGQVPPLRRLSLAIGNDSIEILRELGFSQEQTKKWIADGVVGALSAESLAPAA